MASLKTLSDATFEILGQFFRRVVSILAPNGVKKIAELGNSLRRLHTFFDTMNHIVTKEENGVRHDIREEVRKFMIEDMKPNFAAIAEQYNCDYRTVKKAYEEVQHPTTPATPKPKRPSKLDPYKKQINEKLDILCSAMAIYKFIVKHGFSGKYSIVRDYCAKYKKHQVHKATIRVEHTAGLSAQVDWKEEMTLYNRDGKPFTFNIFLYVLPYSKLKYTTLIFERSQDTLFSCLDDAFYHTGGVPKEIWFDNMKQVPQFSSQVQR